MGQHRMALNVNLLTFVYLSAYFNRLNARVWGLTACGKGGHDEDGEEQTRAEHETESEKVVECHGAEFSICDIPLC